MENTRNTAGVCERCAPLPQGLEGHDMLRTDTGVTIVPPGFVPFRCALCQTVWARRYKGGGEFEWLLSSRGATANA